MIYYSEIKQVSLIFQKSYHYDEIGTFMIKLADILGINFIYIEITSSISPDELNSKLDYLNESSTEPTELFVIADHVTISDKLILPLLQMNQFEIMIIDLDDFTYHGKIPNRIEWNNVLVLLPSESGSTDYYYDISKLSDPVNEIRIIKLYIIFILFLY